MNLLRKLGSIYQQYKGLIRASTWAFSFSVGLLCFKPIYGSETAKAIRKFYQQNPIAEQLLSIEDFLLSSVVFSLAILLWGYTVIFSVYYFAPEKTKSINQIAEKLSFIFEGPAGLLFTCGFFLIGVSASGFLHNAVPTAAKITVIAIMSCLLPATYFRSQAKPFIKDRIWLRENALSIAGCCGLTGIVAMAYIFAEKFITIIQIAPHLFQQ